MKRTHGGDWWRFQEEHQREPLDFSANISPLGVPEGVQRALCAAAASVDRYPDPRCVKLCEALGARHGLSSTQVLCGNGAADLILRLVLAKRPKRALLLAPSFSEYEAALALVDCELSYYQLQEAQDFALDAGILGQLDAQLDLLILCEPNNPTGRCTDKVLLLQLLERCTALGITLLVDECFGDFLDAPEESSLCAHLQTHQNLLLLKAFTKLYGMAGVRLGYVLSANEALLERLALAGQPWAVSSLSQAAGLAALEEKTYVSSLRKLIREERPYLQAGLSALGLRVLAGEANFLLFRSERTLTVALEERGILVRSCADFRGLDATWYRVAVRIREENTRLLDALREVLL